MVDTQKGFTKTCYYELLEVDRKADTKSIEKVPYFMLILIGLQEGSLEVASWQEPRDRHHRNVPISAGGLSMFVEW